MDIIRISQDEINRLKKPFGFQKYNGKFYIYENQLLKIIDNCCYSLKEVESIIEELSLLELKCKPLRKVYNYNNNFIGYTMTYIDNSVRLGDYLSIIKDDDKKGIINSIIDEVSLITHHNFYFNDLHTNNIIVKNNIAYIIDFDSLTHHKMLYCQKNYSNYQIFERNYLVVSAVRDNILKLIVIILSIKDNYYYDRVVANKDISTLIKFIKAKHSINYLYLLDNIKTFDDIKLLKSM